MPASVIVVVVETELVVVDEGVLVVDTTVELVVVMLVEELVVTTVVELVVAGVEEVVSLAVVGVVVLLTELAVDEPLDDDVRLPVGPVADALRLVDAPDEAVELAVPDGDDAVLLWLAVPEDVEPDEVDADGELDVDEALDVDELALVERLTEAELEALAVDPVERLEWLPPS